MLLYINEPYLFVTCRRVDVDLKFSFPGRGNELWSQLQAVGKLIPPCRPSLKRDPGEEEERFQLYKRVVWLVAGRLVYIRNSFILHTVKSAMGLVGGLEDLPC